MIYANNEPCRTTRLASCETNHKRSKVEVGQYGERRDIAGSEADGDVDMAR